MNILNSGRFGMAAGAAGGLRRLIGGAFTLNLILTLYFSNLLA